MARILVGFPRVSQECASYTSHHVILKEMDGLNMKQFHISEVLVFLNVLFEEGRVARLFIS